MHGDEFTACLPVKYRCEQVDQGKMRSLRIHLRFGLRGLLCAVTLAAFWLGRDAQLIRERDRLVQSIDFLRTFEPTPGERSERHLPWHWQLLGARPIEYMAIRLPADQYSLADVERVRAIYPELEVDLLPAVSNVELAGVGRPKVVK